MRVHKHIGYNYFHNVQLLTHSIEVPDKMIKNDRRFTIHITSPVKKIFRTCTGKQTIEAVPVDYFPLQFSSLFTAPTLDLQLAILLYVRWK